MGDVALGTFVNRNTGNCIFLPKLASAMLLDEVSYASVSQSIIRVSIYLNKKLKLQNLKPLCYYLV